MAKIFKSGVGDLRPTFPTQNSQSAGNCSDNNIHCCNSDQSPRQVGVLKRRDILVASTSARVPLTKLVLKPRDQVSSLTDYHHLQNAQKLKFKYASSNVDVASLFPSSDGNGLPVEVGVGRPCAFSGDFRRRRLQEEVVIEGIKVKRRTPLLFDVYIRGDDEEEEYCYCYCGSFIHTPPQKKTSRGDQKKEKEKVASCSLRLGIGHLMENMNAQHEQTRVVVKLVPRLNIDGNPINVESIRIDYS